MVVRDKDASKYQRRKEGGESMTVLMMLPRRNSQPLSAASRERVLRKAPHAQPIAHPFSHEDGRTRCPACELREYLDD